MDSTARIDRLIEAVGEIEAPVEEALRAVPRHMFVPPVVLAGPDGALQLVDRDTDPNAWWDAVYSRMPLVTQLDDGRTPLQAKAGDYSSSSSAPSTVVDLLELLDVGPRHRVLEIGTGTGWTAALLAHLVGDAALVTSIEVDQAVAEQAAKHLGEAGISPRLIVGDGALVVPEGAPYDRVHATCAVTEVPYAWVEQTRPGGVIVAPWHTGFGAGHALRAVVRPDGTAVGRFRRFADYMVMRSQRGGFDAQHGEDSTGRTRVDPRTIAGAPPGAALAMAASTGLRTSTRTEDDGRVLLWLVDPADPGQWALVTYEPGADDYEVYQVGPRPVWDEVVNAYFAWVTWGEPERRRFGVTIVPEGQSIWLDSPDHVIG
ncbi:methyltransferase domain-containing protein [Sinosporangium album]|uniref:methyltransferase domain-containing protein n=1 Tax=Sinosporangium album TaxID=504805 RepID=UPI001FE1D395|nr:methyltransferase domain-containing protein [Sinosporangium album]